MLNNHVVSYFECNEVLVPDTGVFTSPKVVDYTRIGNSLEYYVVLGAIDDQPVYLIAKTDIESIIKVVQIKSVDLDMYDSGFFDLFGYCDKEPSLVAEVTVATKLEIEFCKASTALIREIKGGSNFEPISTTLNEATKSLLSVVRAFEISRTTE
ncbi:hypothetical protein OTK49_02690 [Vibrio coralliirubri]|uniref:hypothetical protein n=1 Tax=Vibrio coralliirubri TaxID=1516159 RepID=UPI00228367C6|nr:hypothetical protein [Vibrio coralliirubri]MCY9861425.1 hypothetical protein [Vibrio coralliirubri]